MSADFPPLIQSIGLATPLERQRLRLTRSAFVVRIRQLLYRHGWPSMYEEVSLPLVQFPAGVPVALASPYRLGPLAHAHGLRLGEAVEAIGTGEASVTAARALGVPPGARILTLDRIAHIRTGQPIEWRIGYCRLPSHAGPHMLGLASAAAERLGRPW
jgi:GntR family transcriptional regulator